MQQEGVIKFNCNWIKAPAPDDAEIIELNDCRDHLYKAGLIGVTPDGIGYGNISRRLKADTFIITGSGTGKLERLSAVHFTTVTKYSINENKLTAEGPVIASSESLTHAMLYELSSVIHAVLHIHHAGLWKYLLNTIPATGNNVAYGTPAMALEIARLFKETNLMHYGIFAMGGHEDGVIAFGENIETANRIIFKWLDQL